MDNYCRNGDACEYIGTCPLIHSDAQRDISAKDRIGRTIQNFSYGQATATMKNLHARYTRSTYIWVPKFDHTIDDARRAVMQCTSGPKCTHKNTCLRKHSDAEQLPSDILHRWFETATNDDLQIFTAITCAYNNIIRRNREDVTTPAQQYGTSHMTTPMVPSRPKSRMMKGARPPIVMSEHALTNLAERRSVSSIQPNSRGGSQTSNPTKSPL
jgi:hypothetical protein